MGSYLNQFLLIAILMAVNAFFAAAEIAILSVKDIRVRHLAEGGNKAAQAVQRLTANSSRMLATIQIGITLAGFLASASAAVGLSSAFGNWLALLPIPGIADVGHPLAVLIVTLIISYFTLVFGELAPKRLALQKAEEIALKVARPIELLAKLAGPIISFLTFSTNLAVRLFGGNLHDQEDEVTEEEIKAFVADHGSLAEAEKDMIYSVFQFGDSAVAQAMVSRLDIVAIPENATVAQAIGLMRDTGYSRLPVYSGSVDDIVGIVNLKDLLQLVLDNKMAGSVSTVVSKPLYVPEQGRAIDLFHEMQNQRVHMAIVIDEYGGTAGIVTMENLVEMVVGDIRDEHDQNEPDEIIIIGPGEALVLGHLTISEVNDEMGWHLPEHEDYETVGGLVNYYLDRIPVTGDMVEVDGISIVVEKMERRRVGRLRLTKLLQPPAGAIQ